MLNEIDYKKLLLFGADGQDTLKSRLIALNSQAANHIRQNWKNPN